MTSSGTSMTTSARSAAAMSQHREAVGLGLRVVGVAQVPDHDVDAGVAQVQRL
jgi:hypothetical protein